jgi:hypothetical protein
MKIEDAKWAKIEKFERFESEMIKFLKVLYISQSNCFELTKRPLYYIVDLEKSLCFFLAKSFERTAQVSLKPLKNPCQKKTQKKKRRPVPWM